jgi:hypothetical protein
MSTTIRPELSEKNQYWIEKHRYYELKHFCMQYPLWRRSYNVLDGMSRPSSYDAIFCKNYTHADPVAKHIEAREFYFNRMRMVEQTAIATDKELYRYILKGVTEGISYDFLKARLEIPCCKDTYYDLYRRFFWLLSQERG